jgi:hypothetical protein
MDRHSVDSKLRSMGYQHPESNNSNTSCYQTYNEFGKDTYVSAEEYHMYASFSSDKVDANPETGSKNPEFCPKCSRKASFVCTCKIGDMMCQKGHTWYTNKKGQIIAEDPHRNEPE